MSVAMPPWWGAVEAQTAQRALARLTAVSPNAGTTGQIVGVVLTGVNFVAGAMTADFGPDIRVDSVAVLSSTKLRVRILIASSASTGPRDIAITRTGPDGGTATLRRGFAVMNPPPRISKISPPGGSRGATTRLTVIGTGYIEGVTSISAGPGISVTSIEVGDSTVMTVVLSIDRDAALTSRDIKISNPGPGGGSAVLSRSFSVQNPTPSVSGCYPAAAALGQTLTVAIDGSGFLGGISTVDFGQGVVVNSTAVDTNGTRIVANISIAPLSSPGERTLKVTNSEPGGGSAALPGGLKVLNPSPTVSGISITSGIKGQTISLIIAGTNFIDGSCTVSFGAGVTVNSTAVISPNSIRSSITISPDAIAASRNIIVTNGPPGGGSATLSSAFGVRNAAPVIVTASPSSATRGQTLDVTLSGSGFYGGLTGASLGSGVTVVSSTVSGLTEMTLGITVAPDAIMGARDVVITNPPPGGGAATLAGAFTVANPAPAITSIGPGSAGRGSLLKVVVIGTQFIDGVTSLNFGPDVSITNLLVKGPSEIQAIIAITSAATPGTRTVTVTNAAPGGGSAGLTGGFTVTSAPASSDEGELGIVPDTYVLQEAYPNPFNPSTRIRYGIPENSRVRIDVHNMLGNVVAELVSGERSKGMYELQWHADNLPSGVYLVRINAESAESAKRFIASRKVVLVK